MAEKKFVRSTKNKVLAGVCGGLAEYANMDPTLVRILYVLLSLMGPGLMLYIVLLIITPEETAEAPTIQKEPEPEAAPKKKKAQKKVEDVEPVKE